MTHTTLRSEEMFDFCTQISMILAGGLSVEEGLEIIGDDTDNPHMKEAAGCLLEQVHVVGSFSAALEEAPYFDTYAKKMVAIGEISGHLDNVMKELALYYERSSDLKQSLKEALTYPSILLLMMWAVVGIIVWKVLPIFEKVLLHMGAALQGTAASMMRFGQLFATASFIILTLFLLGGILLAVTFRKSGGKSFLSHLFMTKQLYHNMVMAKMTYALSLFITSGYEMEEALGYLRDVVGDEAVQKKIDACRSDMQEGKSFSQCLREQALYQGVYASMIITGFHSGKSDEVMQKVSTLYEKDVDTSISTFLNTIEPVIVIVLSVIVGIILLSVMLPLMSIMSSIG